jgi:phosphate-selective porin OprO/OprP
MSVKNNWAVSVVALAVSAGWALPAQAQATDSAAVLQELRDMRARMETMAQRIDTLEAELAAANAKAEAATQVAQSVSATAAQDAAGKAQSAKVAWKGAPQLSTDDGWSFKVRGRINLDAGFVNAPDSTGRVDGFGSEVRRARLGVEGTIPGGFGYKFEAGLPNNDLELADAFVTYSDKGLTIAIGHQNTFQSLEELSSSLHTSFIERAAFTDAFGFERRVGASVQYHTGDLMLQGGLFSDNVSSLPNRNFSADGRVVYMPKLGDTQLHLGGSLHYADLAGQNATVRYRQRPFAHFTSDRFIDTSAFSASSERGIGLEAAMIAGRFHAAGESFWQKVRRSGFADPTFFGGYVELGYFLTPGDSRGYKEGQFDRVKPARGFDKGGIGAIQVNARYDYLDLSDAGIVGGRQKGYQFSVIWSQTAYTKLTLNYARLLYEDAVYPAAGGDRSYGVDAVAMRAQVDF